MSNPVPTRFTYMRSLSLLLGGYLILTPLSNPASAIPLRSNLYSENIERYLVYIDSHSPRTLKKARLIAPGSHLRRYKKHSVIEIGIFNDEHNAQQEVRDLKLSGIRNTKIVLYSDTGEVTKHYYVAIPAKHKDVHRIAKELRESIGQNTKVQEKSQPYGWHVAVGPFVRQSDAKRWYRYIRKLGYGDAMIYHVK